MPATIDDLADLLERLNASVDNLVRNQGAPGSGGSTRYWNRRWSIGPRMRALRGVKKLLGGDWKGAAKEFRKGWKQWKWQRGLGGKLGSFGNVLAIATVLNTFRKAIIAATDAAVEAARKYAQVSGAMAAAVAQRDVRELMRDMEKGNRLAGSASTMMNAEQWRKDQTMEAEIMVDSLGNYILAGLNYVLGAVMSPLNELATGVNEITDQLKKLVGADDEGDPATISEILKDMDRSIWDDQTKRQKAMEELGRQAERMRPARMPPGG